MKKPRRATPPPDQSNATIEHRGSTHDSTVNVDDLVERLMPLTHHLKELQEEARRVGIFPNDRELLSCPKCGLQEDVLIGGYLATTLGPYDPDTGLRFQESLDDDTLFICPNCGAEVREPVE